MKKNNLFKAVGIVILAYVLFSWIVPIIYGIVGAEGEVSKQIGIISIFSVVLETFSGFGSVILYVLLVGAFYGVLKVTGAYDKIMNSFMKFASGKEQTLLIAIMIIMALLSSFAGLDLGFLVVIPFLIGFIVKVGYNKLVALSATVGSIIIGMYGATFAGTLYGYNNEILSLKATDQLLFKVILFVLGLALLIFFVLMYCKKNNLVGDASKVLKANSTKEKTVKASASSKSSKKSVNEKVAKDKKNKTTKERGPIGAIIVSSIMLLVMILGTISWKSMLGVSSFESLHKSWTELKIGGFDILNKIFGGIDAFGTWNTPVRFQTYSILLIIAMIIIAIIYRTSVKDTFEGFVDGIKSFVVPAIITILACSVFVFVYYNPVITPVTQLLLTATDEFNVALSGIYTIINSAVYVDYYYFANAVLYSIASVYEDSAVLSIISVMFANLYSLVMLVAPTSVLLLIGLSISDVEYTSWIKYIWKLALALLLLSFIVFVIMLLV